jgi:SAM-dependent methyltransferase
MALAQLKRMRRRARAWLRSHRQLYRLFRIVKYGPFTGFTHEAPRRALLKRGRAAGWRLLYLGSGGRRQPGMVNLDITDVTGPDVVGDGYRLPFADATFDAVVCEYVIEHVPDPEGFMAASSRVLKPDGYWYLHVPFLQPVHADGIDYQRWTRRGFEQALARVGLQIVDSGVHTGPAMVLFWILKDTLALLLSLGWRPLFWVIRYLLAWLLTPLLLLDLLAMRLPAAEDLACGYYVIARRHMAGQRGP